MSEPSTVDPVAPTVDNSALAPDKPRYKHCCDIFDLAPHMRIFTRDDNGALTEQWIHYQCAPADILATAAPEVQAAVASGLIDTDLQAAIRDAVTAANASDEESVIHAAMPLDAQEQPA